MEGSGREAPHGRCVVCEGNLVPASLEIDVLIPVPLGEMIIGPGSKDQHPQATTGTVTYLRCSTCCLMYDDTPSNLEEKPSSDALGEKVGQQQKSQSSGRIRFRGRKRVD